MHGGPILWVEHYASNDVILIRQCHVTWSVPLKISDIVYLLTSNSRAVCDSMPIGQLIATVQFQWHALLRMPQRYSCANGRVKFKFYFNKWNIKFCTYLSQNFVGWNDFISNTYVQFDSALALIFEEVNISILCDANVIKYNFQMFKQIRILSL